MKASPRSKLSYANVMATVAVFLALGGGAYAATHLKKNSVGTKQLKNGAVTSSKIAKAAKAALAGRQGPPGTGLAAGGTVPAGVTLRGTFSTVSEREKAGLAYAEDSNTFGGSELPSRPVSHVMPKGSPPTAQCPGSAIAPEAAAGQLCVYMSFPEGKSAGAEINVSDPSTNGGSALYYNFETGKEKIVGGGTVSPFGFNIAVTQSGGVLAIVRGSWATTAS